MPSSRRSSSSDNDSLLAPSPKLRNLAVEYAKGAPGAVVVVNLAGNFVVAGPNAVAIAKKLAEGKAGGSRNAQLEWFLRVAARTKPARSGRKAASTGFVRKPDLAQGSVPGFAAQDARQAVETLRKRLG